MAASSQLTALAQRNELAAIVEKTIRSRPLGDVAQLAQAIIEDIEGADWTIAKTDAIAKADDAIPAQATPGDAKTSSPAPKKRSILPAFSRRLMPKPIVVAVAHRLGRDEAKRRLVEGLQYVGEQIASERASLDYSWEDYRLNFRVTAMHQCLDGHTDVEDDMIRIEIHLPFLLRMLADPLANRVESDTELLLQHTS
jgi:hypothetical protein